MGDDAFLNRGFTFQCPAWRRCALQEVLLTKVRLSTNLHGTSRCLADANVSMHSAELLDQDNTLLKALHPLLDTGVAAGRSALCVAAQPGESINTVPGAASELMIRCAAG